MDIEKILKKLREHQVITDLVTAEMLTTTEGLKIKTKLKSQVKEHLKDELNEKE